MKFFNDTFIKGGYRCRMGSNNCLIRERSRVLHDTTPVVDGHNHIQIELQKRRYMGERGIFSRVYAPLIRQGGVNVLVYVVGGDSTSLVAGTDLPLWGTLENLDTIWQEAEESGDAMAICLTSQDIDNALREGKIALILALEGGRPLEGKPTWDTLSSLRNFYRLGVRHVQLVDMGRNRLGDGVATSRTNGRLTPFGIEVVKECNRLGIVVDTAHLNDPGFWDVMETTTAPIVDSHSCTKAFSNIPRNISDERIRAIAQTGGVIGIACYGRLVDAVKWERKETSTLEDLIRHIDHIVGLVGIDHVGIGPDHFEDHGFSPAPGWMEGVYVGVRESYHVVGFQDITQFPNVTEALLTHGYSEGDVKKIMGENLLRVYRSVLPPENH